MHKKKQHVLTNHVYLEELMCCLNMYSFCLKILNTSCSLSDIKLLPKHHGKTILFPHLLCVSAILE